MHKESMDIIDASIDLYTFEKNNYREMGQFDNTHETLSVCTPDVVKDFLALEGCFELSYYRDERNRQLFFAGPSKFK